MNRKTIGFHNNFANGTLTNNRQTYDAKSSIILDMAKLYVYLVESRKLLLITRRVLIILLNFLIESVREEACGPWF